MKRKALSLYLPIYLLGLILLEGTGIPEGRSLVYFAILLFPVLIYIASRKEQFRIPRQASIIYGVFLGISFLSTLFAVNVARSFSYILFLIACYLCFIYAYNNRQFAKIMLWGIFVLSFFFIVYSALIRYLALDQVPAVAPSTGFQFVYPLFGSHNHLGDFLVLPLLILLSFILTRQSRLLSILAALILLPYFLFAYSKSAYLDFVVAGGFLFVAISKLRHISYTRLMPILGLVILLPVLFFFSTVKHISTVPGLGNIQQYVASKQKLSDRSIASGRFSFITEGLQSFWGKPFLGVGPNNFVYASMKNTTSAIWTFTSHNILFDIFVEGGIFTGITFSLFFILLIFRAERNVLFFPLLAMALNFQTDYTFKIYSFLVLFFVLAGILYKEKEEITVRALFPVSALGLFFLSFLLILSSVFASHKAYLPALVTNPTNAAVYEPLINEAVAAKNVSGAKSYLVLYNHFFPGDSGVQTYIGNMYVKLGEDRKGISHLESAYAAYPYGAVSTVEQIYANTVNTKGEKAGKVFADDFFQKVSLMEKAGGLPFDYRVQVSKFCQQIYKLHCPYAFSF